MQALDILRVQVLFRFINIDFSNSGVFQYIGFLELISKACLILRKKINITIVQNDFIVSESELLYLRVIRLETNSGLFQYIRFSELIAYSIFSFVADLFSISVEVSLMFFVEDDTKEIFFDILSAMSFLF